MLEYIVKKKEKLKPAMMAIPTKIDDKVSLLKLKSIGN
jgi:S-adenosylhomocysteine hydrolase